MRATVLLALLILPARGLSAQEQAGADLASLRSATRSFASLDSAVVAGYPREVAHAEGILAIATAFTLGRLRNVAGWRLL